MFPLPAGERVRVRAVKSVPFFLAASDHSSMAPRLIVTRAREQRQNMADSEKRLWHALRSRRFLGYKFRRQVPVGPFIADFACKSARLVIEIDGDSHGNDAREDGTPNGPGGWSVRAGASCASGQATCRGWMR